MIATYALGFPPSRDHVVGQTDSGFEAHATQGSAIPDSSNRWPNRGAPPWAILSPSREAGLTLLRSRIFVIAFSDEHGDTLHLAFSKGKQDADEK